MRMKFHSRLGAALAAALAVPVLAFSGGPAAEPQGGPGGPAAMTADFGQGGPGGQMRDSWGRRPGMRSRMGMHRWGGHEMELGWVINNPKLREQLGITSQQAGKIRQETLNFEKTEIRSRADLQVKRLELHSLLAAETPDRAAIETSLRETNAAQFALEKASIDHRLDMRAMLTPEQRQKLQQLREEFFHRGAGQPRRERGTMRPGRGGMMMHPGAQSAPPAQSHPQQQ